MLAETDITEYPAVAHFVFCSNKFTITRSKFEYTVT